MTLPQGLYAIDWTGPKRALERLPQKLAVAVVEYAYSRLSESPYRSGHSLGLELSGRYSARVGDYRILSRVDDDEHLVQVLTVEHRSNVYRRR